MSRFLAFTGASALALLVWVALPDAGNASTIAADGEPHVVAELGLGCTVNIRAKNTGSREIEIDLRDSKVKTKNGLWKKLDKVAGAVNGACTDDEVYLPTNGNLQSESCNLDLGCGAQRRYKFEIKRGGRTHVQYYPSSNGWTTRTNINLGDVDRHF